MDSNTKRNKLSQAVDNKLTNTTASNGTTATPVSDNNSPPIDRHSPDLINEKLSTNGLNKANSNQSDNQSTTTIPTYSSIFNTSYYRSITQQQQQQQQPKGANNNNQQQLKKQQATDLYSEPSIQSSGGRLPTIHQTKQSNNIAYNDYKDEPHNLQASDLDDNDIDEHLPLSNSMTKIRNGLSNSKRVSPTESSSSPIIGKRSLQITNFDHYHPSTQRCNNKSPHTKISLSASDHHQARQHHNQQTNQPTSFSQHNHHNNNCHHNHFGSSNRKLDWQESGSCIDCDCNNCYLKFKTSMSHDAGCCKGLTGSSKTKSCSKTETMHMILKSIILILVTLLLTMLFVGMIVASQLLPQAFDKLLSATRSFNVTIQG